MEEKELAVYKNRKEAFKRAPDNIKTALENKVEKHNEDVNNAKTKKTDKFTLAVVYWRGVGAYKENPESVRPSVVNAEQWGLGRVNGFLHALKTGEFKVKPYDQDLLPKGHKYSTKSVNIDDMLMTGNNRSVSNFNNDLPLASKDEMWAWFAGANEETLDEDNWERYKKAHAWHDPSKPNERYSYKLPFAKLVDGELKVVFRGVASAMGAITRELKGQDPKQDIENIPKKDFRKIYNLLAKYYEKFGEEPPDFPDTRVVDKRSLGVYKPLTDISEEEKQVLLKELPLSMHFYLREKPYPNDEKTEEELKFLIDLSKYRNLYEDYIVKADQDLVQPFMECIEDHNLIMTKEIFDGMKKLLSESSIFILKLKYHFNRPRPYQVAERLGYNFTAMNSKTAKTPSYPSGHTIQAMMLADYFGSYYSEYKSYFYEIADKISMSRMFGGFHFPSDIRYGKMIFSDYMKHKSESRVLDSSVGEYFDDKIVAEKLEFEDLEVDLNEFILKERKKDVTNFPKRGDNLKVSLRNSQWQVFPIDFAEKIKKDYPSIWSKGGNIKGNDQYRDLVPVQKRGGNVINKREDDAVRLREAWVARHFKDFRIAGVIAQIKWLAVGSRGLKYMKDLVREEMKKVDEKKKRSFNTDDFTILEDSNGLLLKSKEKMKMSLYVDHLSENRSIEVKEDNFVIQGIASSTSIDHYGTEMSIEALKGMKEQIAKGVVILPRHETLSGGQGLAEWDEVIGRTLSSKIKRADIAEGADSDIGHILEVTSQLYMEDERAKNLMRRINRGELIGQSIGGWFDKVRVIEGSNGEIERVIVEEVTLDHIAITRAPANPDSYGLSLFNVRSKLNNFLNRSQTMSSEETEKRQLDESSVVTEPEMGEGKEKTGDGHVEPVLGEHPYKKEERVTPMEEELEGELEEMEVKYEELKDEYDRLKDEYESMKATDRKKEVKMMKEEMERMKYEMSEMEKGKEEKSEELMKVMEEMAMEEKAEPKEEMAMEEKMMKEKMAKEEMAEKEMSEDRMKYMMEKMMKEELSMEEKEELRKIMERMMYEKSVKEEKSVNTENKNTELVDTRSILDNDLNNDKTNISLGEEDMNEKQMQDFAQMIARSVAEAVKPTTVEVEKIETQTDPSVDELRSELARTQNMLAQVMKNPVRRGRHITTTIRGVGAKSAYSDLINRSRSEGVTALTAVVEENVEKLATNKVAEMSSHELRSLLSAGLNAAQRDGLLGQPLASWE